MGVLLTNARIGLVSLNGGHALVADGVVSLVGVNGLTITGNASIRVNTTGTELDVTITIPGSTAPGVRVAFEAATTKSFTATGAQFAVAGSSLTGDFAFDLSAAGDVTVAASNVAVALGPVSITGASGLLLIRSSGAAGRLSAAVSLAIPGVSFGGTLTLSINSSAAPVSASVAVGGTTVTLNLPAGPYLRVEGTAITLTVLGQTLTGDFSIERATLAGGVGRDGDRRAERLVLTGLRLLRHRDHGRRGRAARHGRGARR